MNYYFEKLIPEDVSLKKKRLLEKNNNPTVKKESNTSMYIETHSHIYVLIDSPFLIGKRADLLMVYRKYFQYFQTKVKEL